MILAIVLILTEIIFLTMFKNQKTFDGELVAGDGFEPPTFRL